ncbi:MAG TPA: amidohydrolase family protein [Prosthecobacter sp.]|nr:amidohydrolase family protein [Prosthecobacter sp.]HRK14150.1 amidohydrolase family protein [Prosthecobacter sp.]
MSHPLPRRSVLRLMLACPALAADLRASSSAAADAGESGLVDVNASLFHWPFRRLPDDEPGLLAARLRKLGFHQAWAGSYEALLHRDPDTVNSRLTDACERHGGGLFRPVGCVNPALPGWEETLRRCAEKHAMHAIRLHPNYHGYTLEDPAFERLLALAAQAGLLIQLAASMEDTRTQHPLAHVPDVDLRPLPDLLSGHPQARLMLLNHRPAAAVTAPLAALPNVWFDTARTEATDGVARLVALAGRERVVFGSHAPFLIPEAALIRVEEAMLAGLPEADAAALLGANAARLAAR